MLFITISRTVKYNHEINCALLGNTFFLSEKTTLRPNWAFLDSHHLEMFPEASQSPFWSLVSENIAGRYGPVYCLRRPAKYFKNILEYFWKIWVAGMGVFTSASSGLMFCTNFSDSLLMLKFVRWTKLFEMFSGSFEYGSVANLCASCYFWKYCWIVCFFHELGKMYKDCKLKLALLLQSSKIVCFSIDLVQ